MKSLSQIGVIWLPLLLTVGGLVWVGHGVAGRWSMNREWDRAERRIYEFEQILQASSAVEPQFQGQNLFLPRDAGAIVELRDLETLAEDAGLSVRSISTKRQQELGSRCHMIVVRGALTELCRFVAKVEARSQLAVIKAVDVEGQAETEVRAVINITQCHALGSPPR